MGGVLPHDVQVFPLLDLLPTLRRVVETGDGWAGRWVGVEASSTSTGSQVRHSTRNPWLGAGSKLRASNGGSSWKDNQGPEPQELALGN